MCEACEQLREDNAKLREVVRAQGEFIQRIKREIRDFLVGPEPVKMQRSIADQGFRFQPIAIATFPRITEQDIIDAAPVPSGPSRTV